MARDASIKSIIREGARLIHAKGFHHTGLQEILNAAGIPKGSFYFYFRSKDDFGLAVLDYFWEFIEAMGTKHLSNRGAPPLARLEAFMDAYQEMFENMGLRCGCPIGNLMQEMSDLSEPFRAKVGDIYARMHGRIARILVEAKDAGDLPAGLDPDQTAQFILNSWEGAIMHMKLVKNIEPLRIFRKIIFEHILK
jgi:TetR/AcrR family transcriptional regulator, transcriptional repressor for nem operon